jgi:hypothetical protein
MKATDEQRPDKTVPDRFGELIATIDFAAPLIV